MIFHVSDIPIGLRGIEFPLGITDNLSVSTLSVLPWLPTLSIISTLHSTKGVRGIDLPDGMGENSDPVKVTKFAKLMKCKKSCAKLVGTQGSFTITLTGYRCIFIFDLTRLR